MSLGTAIRIALWLYIFCDTHMLITFQQCKINWKFSKLVLKFLTGPCAKADVTVQEWVNGEPTIKLWLLTNKIGRIGSFVCVQCCISNVRPMFRFFLLFCIYVPFILKLLSSIQCAQKCEMLLLQFRLREESRLSLKDRQKFKYWKFVVMYAYNRHQSCFLIWFLCFFFLIFSLLNLVYL